MNKDFRVLQFRQLAHYSLMLRPDSLVPLLMMLSLYFIAMVLSRSGTRNVALAGASVGLACCLRADVLLYAPFVALFVTEYRMVLPLHYPFKVPGRH
jgi:hypothetical protein